MVATWGAYIFVLNMIACHCGFLLFVGGFNWNLYVSYVGFYVVGTWGALQFPIVGNLVSIFFIFYFLFYFIFYFFFFLFSFFFFLFSFFFFFLSFLYLLLLYLPLYNHPFKF